MQSYKYVALEWARTAALNDVIQYFLEYVRNFLSLSLQILGENPGFKSALGEEKNISSH